MKRIVATLFASVAIAGAGITYASAAVKHHEPESGGWYALSDSSYECYAANRPAGPSEDQLAGPFKSEADASKAAGGMPGCSDLFIGDHG